jgi:hypothetical protein
VSHAGRLWSACWLWFDLMATWSSLQTTSSSMNDWIGTRNLCQWLMCAPNTTTKQCAKSLKKTFLFQVQHDSMWPGVWCGQPVHWNSGGFKQVAHCYFIVSRSTKSIAEGNTTREMAHRLTNRSDIAGGADAPGLGAGAPSQAASSRSRDDRRPSHWGTVTLTVMPRGRVDPPSSAVRPSRI